MTTHTPIHAPTIDWAHWLTRWDAQQAGYLPDREERFAAMLDALAVLLPPNFVAVDLCCGPGAISQRLLARFEQARCIAIDLDPLLLAMGQAVLGEHNGRLRWVEANVADEPLAALLGVEQVDAVLSTTALHWLSAEQLLGVYRQLAQLIRPGGLFLNGDNLTFAPELPTFQRLTDAWDARHQQAAFAQRGQENWRQWWDALAQEEDAQELLAERARRFPQGHERVLVPSVALHQAMLRDVGFREVAPIWQHGDNYVVMGVR